ncbi:DUF2975 domain-containing protein [Zunongwangia sp. H14]|uniref:DUF2975 domain-containing protein n=1 Tax=Zunongwangia sp. H14 TaxID=3240792 RepID=UPI0035645738
MKPPFLLKTILDIAFILLILSFFGTSVVVFFYIFTNEPVIPIFINETEIPRATSAVKLLLVAEILGSALFLYTVFLIKKLIREFFRNKLFTRIQISLLNLVGQLIIFTTIVQGTIQFFEKIVMQQRLSFSIITEFSFGSLWFIIAVGLFFMYLARLFQQAKFIKEEHDLTV